MKRVKLTFLILGYSFHAFCQHGFKQQLRNIATITFPDTPKMQSDINGVLYSRNSKGIYYISQTFLVKENLNDLLTRHLNDSLYARFVRASMSKYDGKLFYKKNITSNGIKGIEYGYKAMVDSVYYYRYRQAFCLNKIFIVNGLSSADSVKANSEGIRAFFYTFKLTIGNSNIEQDNLADIFFTGRFVFYLTITIILLTLLIALIAHIVKKTTYK